MGKFGGGSEGVDHRALPTIQFGSRGKTSHPAVLPNVPQSSAGKIKASLPACHGEHISVVGFGAIHSHRHGSNGIKTKDHSHGIARE